MASTVNTLVLAYAGASLPLLLFFAQGDQPVAPPVTGELIAVEIVRMLVGSIGLVASVPITTALAAVVLGPGDDPHGHPHGDDGLDRGWGEGIDGPGDDDGARSSPDDDAPPATRHRAGGGPDGDAPERVG